jgi:hypothetical protein
MAGTRKDAQGAMAFRRGPAGNHVEPRTRDKWEHQADEAARRIMRGERNVARMLTQAPAASLTLPLSSGEPLPHALRAALEESFGADLSAVRIHRDTAAAAAARNECAHAFTSGRNIYFASDGFSTDNPRGERLLLHEIAHVLQQTGRSGSQGRLRASEAAGAGAIQCDDDFTAFRKLHEPKDTSLLSGYNTLADRLYEAYKTSDSKRFAEGLTKTADFRHMPEESESLLYDTLKLVKKFEAAVSLLERNDFAGGKRIRSA